MRLAKTKKRILMYAAVSALAAVLTAAPAGAEAESAASYELRGSFNGGVSLKDVKSETYGAKLQSVAGFALTGFTVKNKSVNFGLELSYDHHFQSNDKNYYYYPSYERIGLTPLIELSSHGQRVRLYAFGGLGLNVAVSAYMGTGYPSATLGAGLGFQKSFFHGILVSYTRGFVKGYNAFEAYKTGLVFRLLEKGAR